MKKLIIIAISAVTLISAQESKRQEIPVFDEIVRQAEIEWPNNYRMQMHYIEKQSIAYIEKQKLMSQLQELKQVTNKTHSIGAK